MNMCNSNPRRIAAAALSAGGARGSVDVTVNLGGANAEVCTLTPAATAAKRADLRGNWYNPPGTHAKDPATRVRFGIHRGSDETICLRENHR